MTSPFGIPLFAPLDHLAGVRDVSFGLYGVEAATPHPLFPTYYVRATPDLGVVWIKALGAPIENDNFGTATRAAVDRIKDQMAHRYGQGRKTDVLMDGSIWDQPQYWIQGLEANERYYSYLWERPGHSALPEDVESLYVGAMAIDFQTAAVIVEYTSTKLKLADAEDDRRMADFF